MVADAGTQLIIQSQNPNPATKSVISRVGRKIGPVDRRLNDKLLEMKRVMRYERSCSRSRMRQPKRVAT